MRSHVPTGADAGHRHSRKNRFLQRIKRSWKLLGPGLITGASDDDPSGIATYTQAGARFGPQLLWTAVVTYPLMVAVQGMCARIGMVTGEGLMGTIKRHYSKPLMYVILCISFPSIVLNIGADIAGMGAVGNLLFPRVPAALFSIVFTGILLYTIIVWSYARIARVLKWLCIVLFSYILIPFLIDTDWSAVLRSTLLPTFTNSEAYFMALVGILGTTISPYLFFWQASMEVEEKNEWHLVVDKRLIHNVELDVRGGMLYTNIVFYFIILAAGTVLFNSGVHDINTVEEAARALKPLAGDMAYALFALGVIGTGFLAIPVLGGALSYMMAEAFDWPEGLNKKFSQARGFYITLVVSLLIGLGINFIGISPIQALIWTAVLYGLTAPVLIGVILHVCNDRGIMGQYVNGRWTNVAGISTLVIMSAAAFALLYYQFIA
ncbi:MAG: Nramp family divalent metal transporter [Flavobacteriales bacterium]|nr:Nramp family divalent metal transporter [Flavobacteriales bacterium]